MKKTKFAAMPGGVLSHEAAQIAGKELSRIERSHGCVKPSTVVNESRPKSAPLHPHFTWDDAVAAERWREDEARSIIRSVRVITEPDLPHAEQPVVRCFVNVTASEQESDFDGQGYIASTRAIKVDAYREQMLAQAKAEILNWQRRYNDLLTFANAREALETLVGGLNT